VTTLPAHYRDPVILCELQGRSRLEAAIALGIPEGTLSSRLAKARKMLAKRLAVRDVRPVIVAALLTSEATAASTAHALFLRTVRMASQSHTLSRN
jgi:hypothetical protein